MATLLLSPDLALETFQSIEPENWTLGGNQWINRKYLEYHSFYNKLPTVDILLHFATEEIATNDNQKLSNPEPIHAKQILETVTSTPAPAELEFYREELNEYLKDVRIKKVLISAVESGDYETLPDTINNVLNHSIKVTPKVDLKNLVALPKEHENNLLNNWAFERGSSICLVGGTGYGKSTLAMQLSIYLACGKATVGFTPNNKPLKLLNIQNEDSENDIVLMRDGAMQYLTDSEKELVYQNLALVRLRGCEGKNFIAELRRQSKNNSPDIIIINPLLKYYGGDPINSKEVNTFLNDIDTILQEFNCGIIYVHHTIKQGKASRDNPIDTAYSGFGSAAWSNAFRDTINLRPTDNPEYFRIANGKRAGKWGWKEQIIKRSDSVELPFWSLATEQEIIENGLDKTSPKIKETNSSDILQHIPSEPEHTTVNRLVDDTGRSINSLRTHLKYLLIENKIKIISAAGERLLKYSRTSNENN